MPPPRSSSGRVASARQSTLTGFGADAFVTHFANSGAALELSTYHGGPEHHWGKDIAVDSAGNILVAGNTASSDFPTRGTLFAPASGDRGFVRKLLPNGSDFVYSTFFGGSGGETTVGFASNGSGVAFLAGMTGSTVLPVVFCAQPLPGGGVSNGFMAQLDPDGTGCRGRLIFAEMARIRSSRWPRATRRMSGSRAEATRTICRP